jgi:hypothetical protein
VESACTGHMASTHQARLAAEKAAEQTFSTRTFGAAQQEAKSNHGAQLAAAAYRVVASAEATRAEAVKGSVKAHPPLKSILKKNGRYSGYHAMSILGWTSAWSS